MLHNADMHEILPTLPSGSFDSVITDPPYGMSFQSQRSEDGPKHRSLAGDDMVDVSWLREAYRVTKQGGALVLFCEWRRQCTWMRGIISAGYTLRSQVIWDRIHHGMGDLNAYAPCHDVIWYATKGSRPMRGARPRSVYRYQRPSNAEHPTMKPIPLMSAIVRDICQGPVLDPYMGSGSTGVACALHGIDFTGIEIDEEYYDIALTRIIKAGGSE